MTDRATAYAEQVAAGGVTAGALHIAACKRHLHDLERQGTADFPYLWVPEKSNDILDFAESLIISEGCAPKALKLYGNQCFDLGVPMGWVHQDTGFRRFRRKYKSVARQNGKTMENGITGTYIGGFGGYEYGKLFTVATKRRQARLAWEEMKKFIAADSDLSEWFEIKDYLSTIFCLATGCTIEALSQEAGLQDGFRAIFASIDELHQHKDGRVYKAIYNGTAMLDETLISMITTRGSDLNSFCYEMDSYCRNVLTGTVLAEDLFADIYCLDDADDPFDPACFVKANPVQCQTDAGMQNMQTAAQTAKDMGGSDLADYITKRCNRWFEDSDLVFVTGEILKRCLADMDLEQWRGHTCYAGLDLSHGGDLTTISLDFQDDEAADGRPLAFSWSHSYMPRGRLMEHIETDLAPYDLWAKQGLITITGGSGDFKNDYGFILSELRALVERYDLKLAGIGYDPHNADGFLAELDSFGCDLLEIRQSARFLNDGTHDVQLRMKEGRYLIDRRNELQIWSFRNAVITRNSFGEIKVDKMPNARTKRIDPVDACIDARIARMKLSGQPKETDVNQSVASYLELMGGKLTLPTDKSGGFSVR